MQAQHAQPVHVAALEFDSILRRREAIRRSLHLPPATKRTVAQLSDFELLTYLALKPVLYATC